MKQLNRSFKLMFALFLSIFMLNSGCKKSTVNQSELVAPNLANSKSSAMFLAETDIGKKLPNPYTVANMQRALANLATKGDVKKVSNLIKTSHYYLKFMPKNEAEFALLKIDSNLVIYPFPLDVKLSSNGGSSYREPGLPAGVPTYQYAAVPVGYKLPKVGYEILAHLYLPNERNLQAKVAANGLKAIGAPEVSVKDLVNEAENIVCETPIEVYRNGVVVQLLPPPGDCDIGGDGGEYGGGGSGGGGSNCGAPSGEWRPSGRITMTDDVLGLIGVEGLKIRARRWFTTYVGFTDANGNYCVDGTFTRPANYWFDFERYDFSVNDHGGGPQSIGEYKLQGPWNFYLENYDRFCGTIFRAAYHYYYKDIQGLRRPPQNSFWNTQMKLGAYNYTNPDGATEANHSPQRRFFGIGEAIHVYLPISEDFATTKDIYANTIHELAHAVHWDMAASDYRNANENVSESWSVGVQWALTKMVYPSYLGRPNNTPNYTNLIMDLIDLPGEEYYWYIPGKGYYYYGIGSPNDLVKSYSITQIQNSLIGVRNFEAWKNNIFYQYENTTENNLDALFIYWANH